MRDLFLKPLQILFASLLPLHDLHVALEQDSLMKTGAQPNPQYVLTYYRRAHVQSLAWSSGPLSIFLVNTSLVGHEQVCIDGHSLLSYNLFPPPTTI